MNDAELSPAAGIDWDAVAGRPPFAVDAAAVRARVHGRTVLITGAGGSLGRALSMSLAALEPQRLILFDHHESSLFRLRQALLAAHPSVSLQAVLGDVRAERRVGAVLERERPHLIYHLAAYKHVPWGEADPEAFAEVNVLGTRTVLAAAARAGVDQIVYPSTDKAIDPPSLYGATKRIVEGMLEAAARSGGPRASIVRLVNVLGSQGSAPETFARQIRAGQPLSITHPEMRRYWITPGHATLLLLHAACFSDPVVMVAPDTGDEIPTIEIARRVLRQLRPGSGEPAIVITGLRAGERLSEPICAPYERLAPAPLAGVRLVLGRAPVDTRLAADGVERIARLLADGAPPGAIRAAVFEVARALQWA
jgi:FlaA1/EpsC-like NDP-sugar epimerase